MELHCRAVATSQSTVRYFLSSSVRCEPLMAQPMFVQNNAMASFHSHSGNDRTRNIFGARFHGHVNPTDVWHPFNRILHNSLSIHFFDHCFVFFFCFLQLFLPTSWTAQRTRCPWILAREIAMESSSLQVRCSFLDASVRNASL